MPLNSLSHQGPAPVHLRHPSAVEPRNSPALRLISEHSMPLELSPSSVGDSRSKRLLDVALIVLALPFLFPVFALVMLAIKVDSPRASIFFSQHRVGRDGRAFRMWKFRSMVPDAAKVLEQHLSRCPASQAEWNETQKLKCDPRITRLGAFLRKSSIDELPQLWNVVRGEMSLVGPRPIVRDEIPRYKADFRFYRAARPGLTGLWQVSGRSDCSYDERVELDRKYVADWSFGQDLQLLARTIPVVLFGRGAY